MGYTTRPQGLAQGLAQAKALAQSLVVPWWPQALGQGLVVPWWRLGDYLQKKKKISNEIAI